MGNPWIAYFDSSSSSSPSSTRPSSPGMTKSNSNEGTHSGTRSAFSSSLDEVSPNRKWTDPSHYSHFRIEEGDQEVSPGTLLGVRAFESFFKGWTEGRAFARTMVESGMAIASKKRNSSLQTQVKVGIPPDQQRLTFARKKLEGWKDSGGLQNPGGFSSPVE